MNQFNRGLYADCFTINRYTKRHSIQNLIICGAMSHMCIDTTTRAAFDLGYSSIVISDACATRDLTIHGTIVKASEVHAAYMAGLNGLFAEVKMFANWQE